MKEILPGMFEIDGHITFEITKKSKPYLSLHLDRENLSDITHIEFCFDNKVVKKISKKTLYRWIKEAKND